MPLGGHDCCRIWQSHSIQVDRGLAGSSMRDANAPNQVLVLTTKCGAQSRQSFVWDILLAERADRPGLGIQEVEPLREPSMVFSNPGIGSGRCCGDFLL